MAIWPRKKGTLTSKFETAQAETASVQPSVLLRGLKYTWSHPLKAARNFAIAAAAVTIALPAAMRLGYYQVTKDDYDCTISRDPISVKSYNDQTFKEFWNFPLGYMLGLRDTWLNDQIQIFSPMPKNGQVSKFILSAMCTHSGAENAQKEGMSFEISDTWFRSRKNLESADIVAEFKSLADKDVTLHTTGQRRGRWNWFENVLDYEIGQPQP